MANLLSRNRAPYYKLIPFLSLLILPSIVVGQTTIWEEDFNSYSDGTTTGNDNQAPSGDDWTSGGCTCSDADDYWAVENGQFEARDVNSNDVWWESEDIDISSCSNVEFSMDIFQDGDHEGSDYFRVEYRVDGGAWNTSVDLSGNWPDQTVSETGISGNTLEIRVEASNSAGSEYMSFDNVLVQGDCCPHSISSFSPTEGCPDTGTVTVTIDGSGFTSGSGTSDVMFGGVSSTSFSVISDSKIEAEVPVDALDGNIEVKTDGCTVSSGSTFDVSCAVCNDVFVNEFSNGESGSREYMEFIVGNSCGGCHVDLNGWIIDDNNGDFSGGPNTGEGIAQGHVRFDPNGNWENIPTGSIILIYNSADKNLTIKNEPVNDDPHDSNNDSVYVIPIDDPGLQECTSVPNSSDASYSGCSYSSPASWGPISMANSGDACQVRKPDASYFHGVCYGSDTDFDGGPDNLHVHKSSGSDDCFYFGGPDARDVSNWYQGDATDDLSTTDETPGKANNSSNSTEIQEMRVGCSTLPVELISFEGKALEEGNRIRWKTLTEAHHDRFVIERGDDPKDLEPIRTVMGKGGSGEAQRYSILDREAPSLSFYRLRSVDLNGDSQYSRTIVITRENEEKDLVILDQGRSYKLLLPEPSGKVKVRIYNAMGKKVKDLNKSNEGSAFRFRMDGASPGVYFLQYIRGQQRVKTLKFYH